MGNTYRNPKNRGERSLRGARRSAQDPGQRPKARVPDPWGEEKQASHEHRMPINAAKRMVKKNVSREECVKKIKAKFKLSTRDAEDCFETALDHLRLGM